MLLRLAALLWVLLTTLASASLPPRSLPVMIAAATPAPGAPRNPRKDQLINFFAGGMAGTVASCLTIPLEVVKTQLQSSRIGRHQSVPSICRRILNEEGVKGFFRGLQPMLIGIIPTRAIYFWAYSSTKSELSKTSIGDTSLNHLLSAFSAGIASNTISNPLWMVKTRFQLIADKAVGQQEFRSYGEVVRNIWEKEGIRGFYKGLTASYFGCFEGAIQWMAYERLKSRINAQAKLEGKSASSAELFCAAAASKLVAICLTYPHELVRTRMREQASHGAFKYHGAIQTFRRVAAEEGIRGLYSGLGMHLVRSVPNAAIMFVTFEAVGAWLRKTNAASKDDNSF